MIRLNLDRHRLSVLQIRLPVPYLTIQAANAANEVESGSDSNSNASSSTYHHEENQPDRSLRHFTERHIKFVRSQIRKIFRNSSWYLKKPMISQISEHNYCKPIFNAVDDELYSCIKYLFTKHPSDSAELSTYDLDFESEDNREQSYEYLKSFPFLKKVTPSDSSKEMESLKEAKQTRLWLQAIKIINDDLMSRNLLEGKANEVNLKRKLAEEGAAEFRNLFESINWNTELLKWLHHQLLKHLNLVYRSIYLKLIDLLYQKMPESISRFYVTPYHHRRENIRKENRLTCEDPLYLYSMQYYELKRLPKNPFIILVPNNDHKGPMTLSMKYWIRMFHGLGKLIFFPVKSVHNRNRPANANQWLIDKIRECKQNEPKRPIIMVGFDKAAIVAYNFVLAHPQSLTALVCFGFKLKPSTQEPIFGDLTKLAVPTQFIIGENATNVSIKIMEDFISKLKVENSLLVVGGADDKLIISKEKLCDLYLTQTIADRFIAEEMYHFLMPAITKYGPSANVDVSTSQTLPEVNADLNSCPSSSGDFQIVNIGTTDPDHSQDSNASDQNPGTSDQNSSASDQNAGTSDQETKIVKRRGPYKTRALRGLIESEDPQAYRARLHAQIATAVSTFGGENSIAANYLKKQMADEESSGTEETKIKKYLSMILKQTNKRVGINETIEEESDLDDLSDAEESEEEPEEEYLENILPQAGDKENIVDQPNLNQQSKDARETDEEPQEKKLTKTLKGDNKQARVDENIDNQPNVNQQSNEGVPKTDEESQGKKLTKTLKQGNERARVDENIDNQPNLNQPKQPDLFDQQIDKETDSDV